MWSSFRSAVLGLLASPAVAMAPSTSAPGRKTTAEQALRYLDETDQLAPYARSGGTAVVTGGNSGIGAETVRVLAKSGMRVVLCARNLESAAEVRASLPAADRDKVVVQLLDLSDLESVETAAAAIAASCGTVDCLVNNAGIMALKTRETSPQGIELQFGVNHVGHFLLTRLLLPIVSEGGRVVSVASVAHNMARKPLDDWESKEKYTPWGAYGTSKLCNILFAKQLQTELQSEESPSSPPRRGIDSVSLHPGVIKSPLWKHILPGFLQPAVSLIANKNTEQGAATTVLCALSRTVEGGGYYNDCAVATPSTTAQSEQLRTKLWRDTEQLLADRGFQLPALSGSAMPKEVAETN